MGALASWWYRTGPTKLMSMFKRKKKTPGTPKEKRFKTIREAYSITKGVKPWIGAALAAIFVVIWAIIILIGAIAGHPIYAAFVGVPIAVLASLFFFTRVAGSAAYKSIEGQIGAGASVLMAIRKGWTTTPAVAVTRNQEMVHRSVGRPGIVLVGEGGPGARGLLVDERRKTERFAPGVPITEFIVGDGEGQVALRHLQKKMRKLPKKLSTSQMREVRNRLKAVGGLSMPIPKGPLPKGVKIPKR